MKLTRVFVAMVLVILVAATVFAGVDDQGNPNDPAENERANACYEGGTLDGKCGTTDSNGDGVVSEFEIEWHWNCGWYLIRYEAGMILDSSVPEQCQSLLETNIVVPCALVNDAVKGLIANPFFADFVFEFAGYDPTTNDCDPVNPIEIVDSYAISNVDLFFFEDTSLFVRCQESGVYSVGVVYADQTSRTAVITVSGVCSIEQ